MKPHYLGSLSAIEESVFPYVIREPGAVPRAGSPDGVIPPGVELRHLRYFVAVAEAGTFTRAAAQLFIAQPTLSQQIRRLEELVGTPLLQRRPEGVGLTAAGSVLLSESRSVLSLIDQGVRRTRQVAGLGKLRLRVAVSPDMPEALVAATASRLQSETARVGVDVIWLEAAPGPAFALIRERRADAALGWVDPAGRVLPAPLDVMYLGDFQPEAWIPSSHPAVRRQVIGLHELAALKVMHGPRRASSHIYDTWLAILRTADPHFKFADPPFEHSPLVTLAFAAEASPPSAVLSGPRYRARTPRTGTGDGAADSYDMVSVRLDQSPLAATAALAWNGELPRSLQQVLFDTAESIDM